MNAPSLPTIRPMTLVVVSAVYFTTALNIEFWIALQDRLNLESTEAGEMTQLLAVLIAFVLLLNIFLLSLFRFPYVLKPALISLVIIGSATTYFAREYGVLFDDGMLRNALQTDAAEAFGLLSVSLILQVLILGVGPAIVIAVVPVTWARPLRNTVQTLSIACLTLTLALGTVVIHFKATAPFIRSHGKEMRWRTAPYNALLSSYYLARDSAVFSVDTEFQPIALTVSINPRAKTAFSDPILILVVGETARAANFSLNGYDRNTNGALHGLGVTSFTRVSSCGTATAISLPCMFSDLARKEFVPSTASYRENLLDLTRRAGYQTIWIDNQSGSKGIADRVDYRRLPRQGNAETNDLAFVPEVARHLSAQSGRTLLVLHQMGSHGPEYFRRSAIWTKRFVPECTKKQLDQCSSRSIRNAYDNTIVNTSEMLAGIINAARRVNENRPIAVLYISDHGESLGEHGIYLHGMPYLLAPAVQTEVPMLYWANKQFQEFSQTSEQCIESKKSVELSHDNLFDTVLGLLRIQTDAYQNNRDPFFECRLQHELRDRMATTATASQLDSQSETGVER